MDETRKPARLRTRVTIRNHVSGPGGGDEPPLAARERELMGDKEGLLGFASGLVAGVVGVVCGYPFDVSTRPFSGALIGWIDRRVSY